MTDQQALNELDPEAATWFEDIMRFTAPVKPISVDDGIAIEVVEDVLPLTLYELSAKTAEAQHEVERLAEMVDSIPIIAETVDIIVHMGDQVIALPGSWLKDLKLAVVELQCCRQHLWKTQEIVEARNKVREAVDAMGIAAEVLQDLDTRRVNALTAVSDAELDLARAQEDLSRIEEERE